MARHVDDIRVSRVREAFPALRRRENGVPVAYFDGPGGTQVPDVVARAMTAYLFHHNANTHWEYAASRETDLALADARVTLGTLLGCGPAEVVFGANMTTLTLHLSRALAREWGPGDEMVVTDLDHHANIDPWRTVARERGMTVRAVGFDTSSGTLDTAALDRAITSRTRLVAVGAASNALGTVTDVKPVIERAHAAGARVFVDAVHFTPHRLPDMHAWGCDYLACSAYKFYGPHVGVLVINEACGVDIDFPRLDPAGQSMPERAESGTLNHEGIVGAAAAVRWLAGLAGPEGSLRARLERTYHWLETRIGGLGRRLHEELSGIDGVTVYGPPGEAPRTPTVAFTVCDMASSAVNRRLADRGIFCSHGDFYASTVVDRLGLQPEGLVRAGCAIYTTEEEVQRLVDAVRTLASRRRLPTTE